MPFEGIAEGNLMESNNLQLQRILHELEPFLKQGTNPKTNRPYYNHAWEVLEPALKSEPAEVRREIELGNYKYEIKNGKEIRSSSYPGHVVWDALISEKGLVGKKLVVILRESA